MNKETFFQLAKKLSHKSDYEQHKLGAVITYKNVIKGIGFNKRKSHPLSNTRFNNIHAEFSAILNTKEEDLTGCEIFVYRTTKGGRKGLARPCSHCAELLRSVGIYRIHYSTDDGFKTELL